MAKANQARIVTVRGTGSDDKVVLWERNAAHPEGEVFLSNDGKARQAALTPAVQARLREGRLEEVGGDEAKEPAKTRESNPPPKLDVPWVGYDKQSIDEILNELESSDEETRTNVLAFERAKGARGRKTIIDTLVNWDSGAS